MSVCAIFRNEAPYLREWIEFHRIVGFDRFCLYQNNSDDDWQSALRPYLETGVVEVTDWPMASPAQLPAFQDFVDRHGQSDEWVAFIDCDEFLFSPDHGTVLEALDQGPFKECGAVAVNWLCFGAAGQEDVIDGLVIERFTVRPKDTFWMNDYVKCLVKLDRLEALSNNAHHFITRGETVNEQGENVPDKFNSPPTHRLLRINHYATKSRSEWLKRVTLGRVDVPCHRSAGEFENYQAAEVDDRTIRRFLPKLKRRLGAA